MKKDNLKEAIVKHGQYRDVSYINNDGKSETKRCLIVPAVVVEPLIIE